MTTAQSPASGSAEPLSPALDKTFKLGLVLKGLDEGCRARLRSAPAQGSQPPCPVVGPGRPGTA